MRHVPGLDGLRAVAVALVVASHAAHLPAGYIGVDVFFVLSGFLITGLLLEEWRASGRISLAKFYLRRTLRLFPCLWAMVGVTLLASWLLHSPARFASDAREAVFALAYVENWALITGASFGSLFQHTWSLAIEEQFYIVWPLVLAACLDRSAPVGRVIGLMLAGVAALYGGMWLAGAGWLRLFVGSDTRAFELLAGALLGNLYCRGALQLWIAGRPAAVRLSAALGLLSLPLIASLAAPPPAGNSALVQLGVTGLALAIVADICANPKTLIGPLLSCRLLVYLGSISYGIYLWHDPLSWFSNEAEVSLGWRIVIIAGGAVALAAMSYRYIEHPANQLRRRFAAAPTLGQIEPAGVSQDRSAARPAKCPV